MGFLARLTTYVAGMTPRIKALDLNTIQDTIVEIITGAITLKKVHVDGTGNAASSTPDGTMRVSTRGSTTAAPGNTIPWGTVYKDGVVFGGAHIEGSAGSVLGEYNLKSASRVSTGLYELFFNGVTDDHFCLRVHLTPRCTVPYIGIVLTEPTFVAGDTKIQLKFTDLSGTATDTDFYITVYGG